MKKDAEGLLNSYLTLVSVTMSHLDGIAGWLGEENMTETDVPDCQSIRRRREAQYRRMECDRAI